jgi:hypothetical protein
MNAEDLDALRREHQQWEIEQIQAALRDAGCGRFVEHAKVRNVLSIETNLSCRVEPQGSSGPSIRDTPEKAIGFEQTMLGGISVRAALRSVVFDRRISKGTSHLGYPGRVLGTRECSFGLLLPILIYRIVPGELQILAELHDSPKGRPRVVPARA